MHFVEDCGLASMFCQNLLLQAEVENFRQGIESVDIQTLQGIAGLESSELEDLLHPSANCSRGNPRDFLRGRRGVEKGHVVLVSKIQIHPSSIP